jgi:hypothetical protein
MPTVVRLLRVPSFLISRFLRITAFLVSRLLALGSWRLALILAGSRLLPLVRVCRSPLW